MTTKTQQIKDCIGLIIVNLRQLQSILSDDKPTYYPLDDKDLKTPTPPIPSPTWKGTPSVTANGNPPKVNPANDNWKADMTAQINDNNRKMVEALKQAANPAPLPPNSTFLPKIGAGIFIPQIGAGIVCQLLSQSKRTFFYKIVSGLDKGAVIAVNKRTNKVTRDGRYTGNSLRKHTEFVAVVSNDQDGKDYVNGIRKAVFNKRKIYRVYKPKGWAGKFRYCNIYFKRR